MDPYRLRRAIGIVLMVLWLAACTANEPDAQTTSLSVGQEKEDPGLILADDSDGQDWPAFGRTYGEHHYSPLTQINDDSVSALGLAWSYDLQTGDGNPVTGALAVDGVLFFATGYSIVHAMDAKTGALLWKYNPDVASVAGKRLRMGWGIRGIAHWNHKIYTATQDGRLLALDAADGTLVWSVQTLEDNSSKLFISGPPRVFDGKVIIGNAGADQAAVRGFVTAYNAESGDKLWRFYTVPGKPADGFENDAMAMAAATWHGEWWRYGGGGTVWNAMTYDAERDAMLLGVGNGAPWNHRIRSEGKGDNLFLASIVSVDAKTGAYQWHYQVNPGETWDYNASMDMELADVEIDGRLRKVVLTAPKNGFFYVIDRNDGKLLSAEPIANVTWASRVDLESGRPVENPAARYPNGTTFTLWPSSSGAHSWLPMAWHPELDVAYIPVTEMAADFNEFGIDIANWQRVPGNAVDPGTNVNFSLEPGELHGTSSLLAWDPVKQTKVWQIQNPGPWNGGVMATAGNLVFQGLIDGSFNAYTADTGKKLWHFDAGAPVLAPPISYSVEGVQYITVLSGMGTSASSFGPLLPVKSDYRTEAKRVLTFKLGGDTALPPKQPVSLQPVEDPGFDPNTPLSFVGLEIYMRRCGTCHGFDGVAAGQAPDLRASPIILSKQAFGATVRNGREALGMPSFKELSDREMEEVRNYLRLKAAGWRNTSSN